MLASTPAKEVTATFDVEDNAELGGGQVRVRLSDACSDPGSAIAHVVRQMSVFGVAVELVCEVFPAPVVSVEEVAAADLGGEPSH